MRKIARYIYVGLAWFELAVLFIPILLAGMALFVRNSYWSTHVEIGWSAGLPILGLIVFGLIGWIPRRLTVWLVGMSVLHFLHTALPGLKNDLPMGAAVHPVTAVLLAWVTYMHARRATQLLLEPSGGSGRIENVEPNAQA